MNIVQHLQRSPLTRWLWQEWQHEETGQICMLPLWNKPGPNWYRIRMKW